MACDLADGDSDRDLAVDIGDRKVRRSRCPRGCNPGRIRPSREPNFELSESINDGCSDNGGSTENFNCATNSRVRGGSGTVHIRRERWRRSASHWRHGDRSDAHYSVHGCGGRAEIGLKVVGFGGDTLQSKENRLRVAGIRNAWD